MLAIKFRCGNCDHRRLLSGRSEERLLPMQRRAESPFADHAWARHLVARNRNQNQRCDL